MGLHVSEWGAATAPPFVCLHGVTGHGRRFRQLAEERLAAHFRVLAPDLRGHGHSPWEPPWSIDAHVDDLVHSVGFRGIWLGHSFGGRLVLEVAARRPDLVERAILLDPAIEILPHVALDLAEEERKDVSFPSPAEAIQARLDSGRLFHTPRELLEEEMHDHLDRSPDGRLRFRYCRSAVIAAFGELAGPAPPPATLRVPTLIVLGERSWLVLDEHVDRYRTALESLAEVVYVPGGHTVFWDAFDATAGAIEDFLFRDEAVTHASALRE